MGGQTEIPQGIIFMNNQRKRKELEIFNLWNKKKTSREMLNPSPEVLVDKVAHLSIKEFSKYQVNFTCLTFDNHYLKLR